MWTRVWSKWFRLSLRCVSCKCVWASKICEGVSTVRSVLPQHGHGNAPSSTPSRTSLLADPSQNGGQGALWQVHFLFFLFHCCFLVHKVTSPLLNSLPLHRSLPTPYRWEEDKWSIRKEETLVIGRPSPHWEHCWRAEDNLAPRLVWKSSSVNIMHIFLVLKSS